MKKSWMPALLLGALTLAGPAVARLAADGLVPGEKLYVTIGFDNPIFEEHYRYGYNDGKDIVLDTLRERAADDAKKAGWPTPIVVLGDKSQPPPNEPVLRITWTDQNAVVGEYLPNKDAKPYYLGVLSRTALAFGPDPNGAVSRIHSAVNDLARRDQQVKEDVATYLYVALGLTEKHLHIPRP
ncbi:MAG TPA: hypothetical protein VHC86_15435 [Opitutaceae bacterium]|nr:hypothetical protein [Opitutaceae bacterium]